MNDTLRRIIIITLLLPSVMLLARAIGWEAPPWAAADRLYVAAVIRTRMIENNRTVAEVLYDPGDFCTAYLLDRDPPEMEKLLPLAAEALHWNVDELPVKANHFYAPQESRAPPYWADDNCEVFPNVEGLKHRYFYLPCK